MKRLIAVFFLFVASLGAATETAIVTVPDAKVAELVTIIELWIQGQTNLDGSLKYPGPTAGDRRRAKFDDILRKGVRGLIRQACGQFPTDCPQSIKDKIADKVAAFNAIDDEVNTLIQ